SDFIERHPLPVIVSVALGAFLLGVGSATWILFNAYVPNQLYSLQRQLEGCKTGSNSSALPVSRSTSTPRSVSSPQPFVNSTAVVERPAISPSDSAIGELGMTLEALRREL